VRYLSTTTQAITPSQNTVSWNTLDTNTQQDLGINNKNRIINGNMVIDQRNAGASVTPAGSALTYTLDRFAIYCTQSSKLTVQQSTTAPTGFTNSYLVTSLSAYSVISSDEFNITQAIEGFNFSDMAWGTANAKTITLSFWVRSSLTGTFGGALRNASVNRNYPFSYTISTANTFEYKTVTIPGDTTGTWAGATNGTAVLVGFSVGAGSSASGTAGAWAAGNIISATGATSVVGTNGATWYITGVQLEVGTQATTFTLAGGSYGAELALCQRYFQKFSAPVLRGVAVTTAAERMGMVLPVQMRTTPSPTAVSLSVYDGSTAVNVTGITNDYSNNACIEYRFSTDGTMTTGRAAVQYQNGSLSLNSEL
jgi:hypothetical protein